MQYQKRFAITLLVAAFLVVVFISPGPAHAAATITVVNLDGPGEGFNDNNPPDVASALGGNSGATLGEQRFIAFQYAADLWGSFLESSVVIRIGASFEPLSCDAASAILGAAGPEYIARDFPGAPEPDTWYPGALANSLAGTDLDPNIDDIGANFNSSIGTTCPFPKSWYYGLDGNPPPDKIDFVTVVLHEIGHGLGFLTYVDLSTGAKLIGYDDIFMRQLEDHTTGVLYPDMTDAERVAASTNTGNLHWVGPSVVADRGGLTAGRHQPSGHVEMHAPSTQVPGSSVSHFSTSLSPDELMEPLYRGVNQYVGLAAALMQDIGWGTFLGIAPTDVDLATGNSINFTATGGSPPYSWAIVDDDGTKGTLSSTTGEQTTYTAPLEALAGPVTIQVEDDGGQTATASVNVYEALSPPRVTTGSASLIDSTSATLNGTVNANGSSTSYYFEYGTTTTYSSVTSLMDAGSGTSNVSVSAEIDNLSPDATYHFRIVATNSYGTSYGSDYTFKTLPVPYDLVVDILGSGTVELNPPGGTYDAGTVVTLTATTVGDWLFCGWSGALTGVDNPKTITMDSDKNITAKFIEVKLVSGLRFTRLNAVDPNDIVETTGRPADFPYGMLEMEIEVAGVGDTAVVTFTLPNPALADYDWFKYRAIDGWIPFGRGEISGGVGDGAEFDAARTQVTLYLTDNGDYDDDPAERNVRDPSGLGRALAPGAPASASGGGGGGGGCFIATAAYGSSLEGHVEILQRFRDDYLMSIRVGRAFVAAYYRYSPPLADIIARHDHLKAIVRLSLLPLVGFGWITLKLGLVPALALVVLILALMVVCIAVLHKKLLSRGRQAELSPATCHYKL